MRDTANLAAAYRAALDEFLSLPVQAEPHASRIEQFASSGLTAEELACVHAEAAADLIAATSPEALPGLLLRANRALAHALAAATTFAVEDVLGPRPIHDVVERQVEVARRVGRHLCLIVADIDGFRNYNAANGRRAGDEALETILKRFRSVCRGSDVVARCGGDEFCVVMPGGCLRTGLMVAERLREGVCEAGIQPGPLSISLGVAGYPGDAADADALVNLAWEACRMAFLLGGDGIYTPLIAESRPEDEAACEPLLD